MFVSLNIVSTGTVYRRRFHGQKKRFFKSARNVFCLVIVLLGARIAYKGIKSIIQCFKSEIEPDSALDVFAVLKLDLLP